MKYYLKKLSGFSLGPIVGAIISFITIPLITYYISPEEYGRTSMFTLCQGILGMLVYLGTDQSFIKFYNSKEEKGKVFFNCIIPPLLSTIVMMIVMWLFREKLSFWLFGTRNELLCVLSLILYLPFCVFERFCSINERMLEKSVKYSAFSIIVKLLILVFSILLLSSFEKSFRSVVYATVIAQVLGSLLIMCLSFADLDYKNFKLDLKMVCKILKYGIPLVPATIVGWLLNSIDKIMIKEQIGYEQLGLYAAALKIVSVLVIAQSCFASFWSPVAFRWQKEDKDISNFELVGKIVSFFMSMIFILILCFKELIIKILSPDYMEAMYIIPFLLLYPIMYTISEVTVVGIYFTGKSYTTIVIAGVSCILNLILNYTLIPLYGANGAACSTGISYVVFFWLRTLISRRIWKKFKLNNYIFYTALLLLTCVSNVLLNGVTMYIANLSFLIGLIVFNIPLLKKVISFNFSNSK